MQKQETWNNIYIEIWKPLFTSIVATLNYSFDLFYILHLNCYYTEQHKKKLRWAKTDKS